MGDCTERFRNFAERFRNRSAKFQNRSAQSLSETQRKMSSRFLLIPLKDDDDDDACSQTLLPIADHPLFMQPVKVSEGQGCMTHHCQPSNKVCQEAKAKSWETFHEKFSR